MFAKEMLVEFYDPADDQLGVQNYDDLRRPRLTLMHLHKLRVSKDLERVDKAEYLNFLPTMYGVQPEEGGL